MQRLIQSLLLAFALVALVSASTLGFSLGFECEHNDGLALLSETHCHTDAEGTAIACAEPDASACGEPGLPLAHIEVAQDAQLPLAATPLSSPGYTPVLLAELPEPLCLLEAMQAEALLSLQYPEREPGAYAPIAGQVARCIVLLV